MTRRNDAGQTTTEYLMIVGLITTVFIVLSGTTERPFRAMMRDLLQCLADGTTNQLPCDQATSISVSAAGSVPVVSAPSAGNPFSAVTSQMQQIFNQATEVLRTMQQGLMQQVGNLRGAVMPPNPGSHA